jgi:hypothetical protein
MEFNYRDAPAAWEESGQPFDMPGTSCFLRDGDRVGPRGLEPPRAAA